MGQVELQGLNYLHIIGYFRNVTPPVNLFYLMHEFTWLIMWILNKGFDMVKGFDMNGS